MFNIKRPTYNGCLNHLDGNKVYLGYSSYIYSVKWSDFVVEMNKYINIAYKISDNKEEYDLIKAIE